MASDGPVATDAPRRVGIVAIHGVGDTEPGYCINSLMDGLGRLDPGYKVSAHTEYERLTLPPDDADPVTFPVARRRAGHRDGLQLTAFELHWADITRLEPGRIAALLGLFRVIFESHHLVDAMIERGRSVWNSAVRAMLLIAGWMMRGPMAALTIATSAICILLLFGPVELNFGPQDARIKFLGIQGLLLLAAVIALVFIIRHKDVSWYDTVFWLVITTFGLIALDLNSLLFPVLDYVPALKFGDVDKADCSLIDNAGACYINELYKVIIWGWRIWGLMVFACIVILTFKMMAARSNTARADVAKIATSISTVILQFMLWTTIVVTALYPMLNRAETNSTLKQAHGVIFEAVDAGKIPKDSPVVKMVQVPNIDLEWIDRFRFIYGSTAMTIILFVLCAGVLLEIRRVKANRGREDLKRIAERMPKLLFNRTLVTMLILSFLAVITMVIFQPRLDQVPSFVKFRENFLPFATFVALVLPFFIGQKITNVVHIARDLIDHQYSPRIETGTYFIPSLRNVRHIRPRRAAIQGRLLALLEKFVAKERFDEVIFVAHSQGSVVAYDFIRAEAPDYPELGGAKPSLISCGSPLGPVYQKYFYEYGPKDFMPAPMAGALSRWINLYRVDDYIGGRVEVAKGLVIDNRVLPPGGHMDYWSEPAVAAAIDALLRPDAAGKPPAAAATPSTAPGHAMAEA